MRRLLAVLLIVVALAASAGLVQAADAVNLRFYYPVQVAGPLAQVIEQMVNEFNEEHPGIRVQPVYSGNYDETMQRVQTGVLSNNVPDIAVLLAIDLFTLRSIDAIVPLDEYLAGDPEYLADFYEGFLENSQWGGQTWSIPFQRSTPLLYYNKDIFRQAGLDPDRPPQTWEELLDYSAKLTTRDSAGNVTRWGLTIVTKDTWMLQAFILQNGGMYCNAEGTETYFDTPEAVEALQFWVDLANTHRVMPRHKDYGEAGADFVAGQTAMMYNSTGSLSFVRNSATFEFGVAPLPGHKEVAVPTGGGNFYVFKGIPQERRDAAMTFIKWMTSPERVAEWSIASGYIAVRQSAFETAMMQDYAATFPQALVARDQLEQARREMALHNNSQIREAFQTAIDEALAGQATPAQALAMAQRNAERILRHWN